MDTSEEKKPRRPRIGENRIAASSAGEGSFSNAERTATPGDDASSDAPRREYSSYDRPYQPRPYAQRGYNNGRSGYNNQGGYNNNRQGGYNRYNNNQQGGYQPRQYQQPVEGAENTSADAASGDNATSTGYNQQGGYNNNRQGGYNNNRYNNNRQHNGYNNNRQQGGYNNYQQGGYNNNRQQGGYNNNRQGGYNNNNRQQGGYNNNRQGGYNNNRQQGGYNNNRQGGYNNNNRQGGYNNNRQGGYNNRQQGNRQQQGFQRPGKSFVPRPKRIEYEMPIPDPNEQIRLNKFMANAGICSRREADEFITQGLVKVNGEVVTELGTKISHSDVVEYDEKVVTLESKCYILLNKPKDCVTTSDDPNGRTTVMDLVKGACNERIYPVGRLDRNTTGVLLLTNDGDLASKLTHPKYVKKKIYHVWTDKDISEEDMQAIADGIELEDGPIHADAISYATETDRNQAGIEIHSGRNRIVRRIFESLGYHVTKLDRVYFAGLTKKNLPRGRWRYLTQEEVNFLKMGSFE
ncbi:MAG: RNA-binding S4 domain-containing protein [Bacteroides sp.]|nr:RNA-binding S4 domain-containing protein [Bacteroides sp.]MCM1331089.1 RNA-binding S4 domain-containing protein [Bacteroides sp.]MCM1389124.1 RNA-binding S4 domain-containing protein [Bacteroides sp.]MCM1389130.1 RNA-binding S4 domain-containing protein [Bacteroides sp.]